MNIYEKHLFENPNEYTKFKQNREKQNFRGNITRPIKTFQLGAGELSLAKDISKNYQQLILIYKTAGNHIGKLFQNAISFLLPVGALGLLFKNASSSDGIKDVKLEREDGLNKSDELLTFTFRDKNENDIAKISVSKNGEAGIIADDELNDKELSKYVTEIENNR